MRSLDRGLFPAAVIPLLGLLLLPAACGPGAEQTGPGPVLEPPVDNVNIWRLGLNEDPQVAAPQRWLASPHLDFDPAYSPNGASIAFISRRSGYDEVWRTEASGENPRQLTTFEHGAAPGEAAVAHPTWSPDGDALIVAASGNRGSALWRIPAAGGEPRRLKTPGDAAAPCWADAHSLYFVSAPENGPAAVWHLDLETEEAAPLPLSSAGAIDGVRPHLACGVTAEGEEWLYFTVGAPGAPARLHQVTVREGQVRRDRQLALLPSPEWTAAHDGYFTFGERQRQAVLMYFPDFSATRRVVPANLGQLAGGQVLPRGGLAVSPDRRWVLYTRVERAGEDTAEPWRADSHSSVMTTEEPSDLDPSEQESPSQ